mgnify:CR=1 FL=1
MTTGLIYGFIGFLFGAICGGALLGPIGGLFGAVIGGGTGHFLGKLFHVGFAQMAATKPVRVTCPASGEDVKLRIDPKEARRPSKPAPDGRDLPTATEGANGR